jgi:hypothetical protein
LLHVLHEAYNLPTAIPFVANLASGRKYFPRGPFHLGKFGFVVNILAVLFIILFDLFFCFPFVYPVEISLMNWNSVILAGTVFITAVWWVIHAKRNYPGPRVMSLYIHTDGVTPAQIVDAQAAMPYADKKDA